MYVLNMFKTICLQHCVIDITTMIVGIYLCNIFWFFAFTYR